MLLWYFSMYTHAPETNIVSLEGRAVLFEANVGANNESINRRSPQKLRRRIYWRYNLENVLVADNSRNGGRFPGTNTKLPAYGFL